MKVGEEYILKIGCVGIYCFKLIAIVFYNPVDTFIIKNKAIHFFNCTIFLIKTAKLLLQVVLYFLILKKNCKKLQTLFYNCFYKLIKQFKKYNYNT